MDLLVLLRSHRRVRGLGGRGEGTPGAELQIEGRFLRLVSHLLARM